MFGIFTSGLWILLGFGAAFVGTIAAAFGRGWARLTAVGVGLILCILIPAVH
jgi:hypothetical protein